MSRRSMRTGLATPRSLSRRSMRLSLRSARIQSCPDRPSASHGPSGPRGRRAGALLPRPVFRTPRRARSLVSSTDPPLLGNGSARPRSRAGHFSASPENALCDRGRIRSSWRGVGLATKPFPDCSAAIGACAAFRDAASEERRAKRPRHTFVAHTPAYGLAASFSSSDAVT